MLLLAAYSAGLAVPFLIAAAALDAFLDGSSDSAGTCPG